MERLVCVAALVLFVQGALVWGKQRLERHVRDFGILTACVAALTLAAYLLFTDGMFVFSREFGYFLVGGEGARTWLSLLLVATGVVAGLGWRIARIEARGEMTFPWYLTMGLVVGALSVGGIEQVRSEEGLLPALPLHYYDVWSCPLVLWLGACLAGALLSVLRWQKKIELRRLGGRSVDAVHVCGVAAVAVLLAFAAVAERSGVFDDGVGLWNAVLFVAAPLSIAAARLASHGTPAVRWPIVLYPAAGLVPASIAYEVPALVLTFGLASWVLAMLVALRSLLLDKLFRRPMQPPSNPVADSRKSSRPVVAFLILLVASSLGAAVLGFGNIDIAVTITLFFVGWTVLSDLLWEDGLFVRISGLAREPAKILHAFTAVSGSAGKAFGTAFARVEKALSADSWYGAAFKVFLGLVFIIGLAELPNAGRTIIMPFSYRVRLATLRSAPSSRTVSFTSSRCWPRTSRAISRSRSTPIHDLRSIRTS